MVGKADNAQEDVSFSNLLEDSYNFDPPQRGDIRNADILEIRDNEIVVDLGVKRDGIIPPQDIERLNPKVLKSLREGDVIPVYILNPSDRDGNLLVSLNLGLQGQDWERARDMLESEELVQVKITGYNKGGLLVKFGRLEGFVPASHTLEYQQGFSSPEVRQHADDNIGQEIGVKVLEVNQGRRRLILSQREAQKEWQTQQKQQLMEELEVGDIVKGRVTGIRDFGVFVNIGNADGLIHVSELAWHRVPHPNDVVDIGQELDVYILELDEKKQRIALSLRRTLPDPWEIVEQSYSIGDVVEGEVSNVVDFGAFIVLDDGIEGLLHVSEMGAGQISEPYSYLRRGDRVTVKIVRIEPERKRIGFSQTDLGLEHPSATLSEHIEQEADLEDPDVEDSTVDVEDEAITEIPDEDEDVN